MLSVPKHELVSFAGHPNGCNACVARVSRPAKRRIDGEQAMPAQKETVCGKCIERLSC
jgi:hypothetical protein